MNDFKDLDNYFNSDIFKEFINLFKQVVEDLSNIIIEIVSEIEKEQEIKSVEVLENEEI